MTITLPAGAGRVMVARRSQSRESGTRSGELKRRLGVARRSAGFPLLGPAAERAEAGATEFRVDIEGVAVPCRVSAGRWPSRYDRSPAGVRPHILIHPETGDARQPGRVVDQRLPRGVP